MPQIARRTFIKAAAAAGISVALPARRAHARWAANQVNLGFIGCGSRGKKLAGFFAGIEGVNIAALCDPDEAMFGPLHEQYPDADVHQDLRHVLDRQDIDAVVIATCNHWHCLAAIWAMQAGKDVYVEKPLSHTQWEGQQTVAAVAKYNRICQVGTHQRSDPLQAEIKKLLHEEQALGEILSVRANRYGVREPIGRRSSPLTIPASVDYDLWLGPAEDRPILRDQLHYDWHWDWNTGSGEMGNWGVHIIDDVRNTVFLDAAPFPQRILSGGGRVAWNDAGETPNVHIVYFDTGSVPVVMGLSNLTASPEVEDTAPHVGPASGYIVACEGGQLYGQRGKFAAYDQDGIIIRELETPGGNHHHQRNFIDAVRAQDGSILNSPVTSGHYSTGWCNLANVAVRSGKPYSHAGAEQCDSSLWSDVVQNTGELLSAHQIPPDAAALRMSALLEFDGKLEEFVGTDAAAANGWLRRDYRGGFELPVLVTTEEAAAGG